MPKVQQPALRVSKGRRRYGRVQQLGVSLSEINVIPLVDVMLVVLIVFMVTAPMMQRGLDVNLPEARRSQGISSERMFITVPLSYRTDRLVQIGDEPVDIEVLHERIRQTLVDRDDKDVYLRGDGSITYQELMSVMDKLKDGGVERVGLITAPVIEP